MFLMMAALSRVPISVDSNWGASSSALNPSSSATRTLTVPTGHAGNLRFNFTSSDTSGLTYVKNGAAGVSVTEALVVNFSDTDTLAFSYSQVSADTIAINVVDTQAGKLVGTCSIERT